MHLLIIHTNKKHDIITIIIINIFGGPAAQETLWTRLKMRGFPRKKGPKQENLNLPSVQLISDSPCSPRWDASKPQHSL